MIITINKKRIELAVKQLIDPVNWNEGKGMAKGNKELENGSKARQIVNANSISKNC